MSNIYIQEPPTSGKILLQTSVGDIDIELWSKEAPKACRNFTQLCLEGYYDGTIFHRVIKGFIVQGGDPEGTGFGGESVYGKPFKNEIHSRLRFVRRGLVAMANTGKEDNGSQFFFTFGACPELQGKHTIFGKVTGNTLYNMLKLEESLVDSDDKPIYPHKILTCKILDNPFEDIVPRISVKEETVVQEKVVEKGKKNYSLLSFGEEAEEDEAEADAVVKEFRGKSKSSHDLAKDPVLSSVPAVLKQDISSVLPDPALLENVRKKLKKGSDENKVSQTLIKTEPVPTVSTNENESQVDLKRKEIQKEIKQLKKELRRKKDQKEEPEEEAVEESNEKETEDPLLAEYNKQIVNFSKKRSLIAPKGEEREKQTLEILSKFKNKLLAVKETKTDSDEEKSDSVQMESNEEDDDDDAKWLSHKLHFEDQDPVVAKDVNMPSADRYDITDPRNPINQRRRHSEQKGSKSNI